MKLAILDDYQRLALRVADWARLEKRGVEITVFNEAFASTDDAADKLAPFDMLCLMRERTPFPRALIERLPNLKFMALTGLRDAPASVVHEPTRDPLLVASTGYPQPCVDYAERRARALDLLAPRARRG